MAISSVTSSVASQAAAAATPRPQPVKAERSENDGDNDDKKAASVQANKPAATGSVGTIVNTTA